MGHPQSKQVNRTPNQMRDNLVQPHRKATIEVDTLLIRIRKIVTRSINYNFGVGTSDIIVTNPSYASSDTSIAESESKFNTKTVLLDEIQLLENDKTTKETNF